MWHLNSDVVCKQANGMEWYDSELNLFTHHLMHLHKTENHKQSDDTAT